MTLTPEKLAAIRAAAEAATPGEWLAQHSGYDDDSSEVCVPSSEGTAFTTGAQECSPENAAHIALSCPANVLALLDAFADLQKENARIGGELEQVRTLIDRLIREAQMWAIEARTHKSTVHDAYQAVTGATGEPGNWHGAQPIIDALEALRTARDAALEDVARLRALADDNTAIVERVGWTDEETPRFTATLVFQSGAPKHLSYNTVWKARPVVVVEQHVLAETAPADGGRDA